MFLLTSGKGKVRRISNLEDPVLDISFFEGIIQKYQKMASIGIPNLSWDNERSNRCKWMREKRSGAQANITQRNNLEEVRRIVVVKTRERNTTQQDVVIFERAPKCAHN